jgi:nucleoside-diphosphate-sugar epimerase
VNLARIRTLVTGGSRFIGSHLCDRLLPNGHQILCVGNFYTGRQQNIEHLLPNPRFEVNIALACEKLNWFPKVQLREGLKRTSDYFRSTLPDMVPNLRMLNEYASAEQSQSSRVIRDGF